MKTCAPVDDPFEREHLLVREAPVLTFGPRAFELAPDELVRWIGLDLAAGVPHELGSVHERFADRRQRGDVSFAARFYQLGSALAVLSEIDEPQSEHRVLEHRVLEVLGARGAIRARLNLARPRSRTLAASRPGATNGDGAAAAPLAHGNLRIFGADASEAAQACARVLRHLVILGLEPRPGVFGAGEPCYLPPAAGRMPCELPADDAAVVLKLVELLQALPADGTKARPARRLAAVDERVKRPDGSTVASRYVLHRAGTGVVHGRRREVESGPERPGLVRTWNVAGLRGGSRVRIREVGGRAVCELGGSHDAVTTAAAFVREKLGGRG